MRSFSSAVKFFGLLIPIIAAPAFASGLISGQELDTQIRQKLETIGLSGTPAVNPKRQFAACSSDLEISPLFGNWKTVSVRCPDEGGWQIAVRTRIEAAEPAAGNKAAKPGQKSRKVGLANPPRGGATQHEAKAMLHVAALSRPFKRDEVITPDDIIMISVKKANASGMFPQADDLIGRKVKKSISAYRPVYARQLFMPWMITAGQEVQIEVEIAGIAVSVLGIAEENGQYLDWINVRNARSGKRVNAQVAGPKKLTISTKKY